MSLGKQAQVPHAFDLDSRKFQKTQVFHLSSAALPHPVMINATSVCFSFSHVLLNDISIHGNWFQDPRSKVTHVS